MGTYSDYYAVYKKSDKKESDYLNKEDEKEEKKKPKRDTRWQALLQIMAGIESPKTNVTITNEESSVEQPVEQLLISKEDPNYIPETPQPLWSPTEVRKYHSKQQMHDNVKIAYDFLTETWGFSPAAASGIIGNLRWENLANPTQTVSDSNGTTAFGIASFNSKGRLPAFEKYIQRYGLDKNNIKHQLAYIGSSIHNEKNLQKLRDPNITPEEASEIFGHHFEVFAGADGKGYKNYQDPEHMRRKLFAREVYQYFNN